jgi:hypothetical protein
MVEYMARLVGVDLPREKRVEIALTYIFGMGLTRSQKTLAATGISPDVRVKDLQTTKSKVTFDAKSLATSDVKSKFKVTKVFATARDSQFAVSAHTPTRARVRVLVKQLLARRR